MLLSLKTKHLQQEYLCGIMLLVFMQPKDVKDALKGLVLALTGLGSIFEVLFSRSDICNKPIPSWLQVGEFMISIMWQTCCGERAGSHANLVKTERRTELDPQIISSLCYNSFNIPSLHEIDFGPCIEKWRENGRRMGVLKGSTDKDESKVVARLQMESKRAFLFTKGSPYEARQQRFLNIKSELFISF